MRRLALVPKDGSANLPTDEGYAGAVDTEAVVPAEYRLRSRRWQTWPPVRVIKGA
jgi:hypothetical protein